MTFSFEDVQTLEANDGSGKPLTPVSRDELPPAFIGFLSSLEATFRQSLGRLGDGTKFFIFDAGAVRACEDGGLSIPFAGETYTWDTPFPGCTARGSLTEPTPTPTFGVGTDRAAPGAPPSAPTASAQKAVLYEEDTNNPLGSRYVGSAVWRNVQLPSALGQSSDPAVTADVEIPDQRIGVQVSLRRNGDKELPASHTIEIRFKLPVDFAHGGISNIPGMLMKEAESTRGMPLVSRAVKVDDKFFMVGLSSTDADINATSGFSSNVAGSTSPSFTAMENGPSLRSKRAHQANAHCLMPLRLGPMPRRPVRHKRTAEEQLVRAPISGAKATLPRSADLHARMQIDPSASHRSPSR